MSAAALDLKALPGIKEREFADMGSCRLCGRPLLESGVPLFYRIKIERAGFDRRALDRRIGMGMMMGGTPEGFAIAAVMGPNEDLAKVISGPVTVAVHETCADKLHHLLQLFPEEIAPAPEPARTEEGADGHAD